MPTSKVAFAKAKLRLNAATSRLARDIQSRKADAIVTACREFLAAYDAYKAADKPPPS